MMARVAALQSRKFRIGLGIAVVVIALATIGTVVTVFGATVLTSVRAVPSSSEQYGTAGWDPSVRVREPTNSPSDQFDPLPVHDVVVAPDGSRSSTVAGNEPR